MLGEFFITFFVMKSLLVYFREFFFNYGKKKAWGGDYFVALVSMAIGGYLTQWTFFGKNFELITMVLSYTFIYYWGVKKKFTYEDIITPLYIICLVLFIPFLTNVLGPGIYSYSI